MEDVNKTTNKTNDIDNNDDINNMTNNDIDNSTITNTNNDTDNSTVNFTDKSIGMELRLKRIERHLKLIDVAEAIGISKNFMSEIERMKKMPSDEVIEKLADFFGFDKKYLYDRFDRIPSKVAEELRSNERISNILYEITHNDELSEEDKDKLYEALERVYKTHFSNKG